ncbi:MAG: DUF2066 domain-containing protein [Pseudomonadota bacterium]
MRSLGFLLVFASVVAGTAAPLAHAASLESRITVPSRGDSERAAGAIRALFNVLGELYPSDHPMTASERREIAGEANDFVQRYGYLTDDAGQIVLRLQFDETAIRARVSSLVGEPTDVPGVEAALLWLVVAQDTEDLVLTEGAQGVLPDTLDQIANAIGQPLLYPRDDALQQAGLSTRDIRNADESRLLPASQSYPASQVVVLRMTADGDQWRGDWTLLGASERWSSAGSLSDMLQIGLTAYQGRAAALAAAAQAAGGFGSSAGDVTLAIGGAVRATDYAWVLIELRERFRTGQVRIAAVSGGQLLFVLREAGDVPSVAQTLATIPQLQVILPSQSEAVAGQRAADLSYLLVR